MCLKIIGKGIPNAPHHFLKGVRTCAHTHTHIYITLETTAGQNLLKPQLCSELLTTHLCWVVPGRELYARGLKVLGGLERPGSIAGEGLSCEAAPDTGHLLFSLLVCSLSVC